MRRRAFLAALAAAVAALWRRPAPFDLDAAPTRPGALTLGEYRRIRKGQR